MIPETTTKTHAHKKAKPTLADDYVRKIEAQGKEWDAQLALWGAKADKATAEVKADFHKWQKDFRDQRGVAIKKLDAFREANHDAWEDVKAGVETGWNDVKTAFETAKNKYN